MDQLKKYQKLDKDLGKAFFYCYNINDVGVMNTQTKRKFSLLREGCYASSKEGEFVSIQSYKHDGNLHRTWWDTMVLKTSEFSVIGVNDHTLVTESDGRRWLPRTSNCIFS